MHGGYGIYRLSIPGIRVEKTLTPFCFLWAPKLHLPGAKHLFGKNIKTYLLTLFIDTERFAVEGR